MRSSPYGFEIVENCSNCSFRDNTFFCNLGPAALKAFDQASVASVYPGGSVLYVEGQAARGVFMVCRGKAKLSIASRDGKSLITRVAHNGELLGVGSAILDAPYQATVRRSSRARSGTSSAKSSSSSSASTLTPATASPSSSATSAITPTTTSARSASRRLCQGATRAWSPAAAKGQR